MHFFWSGALHPSFLNSIDGLIIQLAFRYSVLVDKIWEGREKRKSVNWKRGQLDFNGAVLRMIAFCLFGLFHRPTVHLCGISNVFHYNLYLSRKAWLCQYFLGSGVMFTKPLPILPKPRGFE